MEEIKNAVSLDAVKEQFCVADKRVVLERISERLESVWDIDGAAELALHIGRKMEAGIKDAGCSWEPAERIMWAVKEAFILGCLDMAEKMMHVNDMGYETLAGKG